MSAAHQVPNSGSAPAPNGGKSPALADAKTSLNKTQMDAIVKFNSKIKLLATDMRSKFPNDATVARAHKRVMLATDTVPQFIIDAIGEYLISYEKQIHARDEKFFLANNFDAEIKAGVVQEKIDLVLYIMPRVKDVYLKLGAPQRAGYMTLVDEMLGAYLDYKLG